MVQVGFKLRGERWMRTRGEERVRIKSEREQTRDSKEQKEEMKS